MISIQDALAQINAVKPKPEPELIPIASAMGRVLAQDVIALIDMPPFPAANMDGYAVSTCETGDVLKIIGESAAGHPFEGRISQGEAVRISTGAMLPVGTDRVLMQEHATRKGDEVSVNRGPKSAKHIRAAASDFAAGSLLLPSGHRLEAAGLTLTTAAGHAELVVNRKLKIAIFSSGDEIQSPGSDLKRGNIYAANTVGLKPLLEHWGAATTDLGIVADTADAIDALFERLSDFDLIIPIGGASVGDHDHMRPGFERAGFDILFQTVAIRPGKPIWMARKFDQIVFGLPGNPASAFVCAHLFLRPFLGLETQYLQAYLEHPIEENGPRETYLRAQACIKDGQLRATPESEQGSFRLRPQSKANAFIRVPAMGGPYIAGEMLDIILMGKLVTTG